METDPQEILQAGSSAYNKACRQACTIAFDLTVYSMNGMIGVSGKRWSDAYTQYRGYLKVVPLVKIMPNAVSYLPQQPI